MKTNKTGQEDIDYILDNFNFERVKKVMDILDWEWYDAEEGVPSIIELRTCARRLLKEVLSKGIKTKKDTQISTGGFRASYYKEEDLLELEFIVENVDNDILLGERIENKE